MRARPLLALLLALATCLAVAACGGGGGSSSSTASTTSSQASGGSSSTSATAPAPAPKPSGSSAASETAAERRAAGRAAPFVKPSADNSVPTFGAEANTSQRDRAEAALKAYLRARAGGDWPTACTYLAASTRQGFERLAKGATSGCAPILAALSKGADRTDPFTGSLVSLRVQGATAFALFYGSHHQRYIVPMAREGSSWKLTQTAPIAYPLGAPTTAP